MACSVNPFTGREEELNLSRATDAKHVVVIGHVSGNVTASERVEGQASGIVDGDIQAPRLLIAEGAVVNGSIQMGGEPTASTEATASDEATRQTG